MQTILDVFNTLASSYLCVVRPESRADPCMCRPEDISLDLSFDNFEQTTQLLRQRLGMSSWNHLWTGSPDAKQLGLYNPTTPQTSPQKAAATPTLQLEQEGGQALADNSIDEDVSAFSSGTRALLQQLQAVKV